MRLTRAGEYGVRCVLYLAGQPYGKVVNRMEIANAMDIPGQFLSKIARQLAVAGIVDIIQGAKGGLKLAMSADRVSLLQVVEAITGEIFLNDCLASPGSCQRTPECSVHRVWSQARNQLRETLRQTTFAQLIEKDNCLVPLQEPEQA